MKNSKMKKSMVTETTLLPVNIETMDIVYQDSVQRIRRIVAHFDGFDKEYFVSDHGLRAALLLVRNGDVLLVRQYRLLINGLSLEIPGGRVDEDETPEAAAVRECSEETGVRCSAVKPLISYHPSLDIWKNYTYLFYSEEIQEVSEDHSDRRVWVPLPHAINMIFQGSIVDSLSILALLSYRALVNKE